MSLICQRGCIFGERVGFGLSIVCCAKQFEHSHIPGSTRGVPVRSSMQVNASLQGSIWHGQVCWPTGKGISHAVEPTISRNRISSRSLSCGLALQGKETLGGRYFGDQRNVLPVDGLHETFRVPHSIDAYRLGVTRRSMEPPCRLPGEYKQVSMPGDACISSRPWQTFTGRVDCWCRCSESRHMWVQTHLVRDTQVAHMDI